MFQREESSWEAVTEIKWRELMPLVALLVLCFITFNNYNILQRAAKFTGKISDSNLICCLEDSWQNEGYFLVKHRLSIWETPGFLARALPQACLSSHQPRGHGQTGKNGHNWGALQGPCPTLTESQEGGWARSMGAGAYGSRFQYWTGRSGETSSSTAWVRFFFFFCPVFSLI